jgi:hypothetical protein
VAWVGLQVQEVATVRRMSVSKMTHSTTMTRTVHSLPVGYDRLPSTSHPSNSVPVQPIQDIRVPVRRARLDLSTAK